MLSVYSLTLASNCYTLNLCSSVKIILMNRAWEDQKLVFDTDYFLILFSMPTSGLALMNKVIWRQTSVFVET